MGLHTRTIEDLLFSQSIEVIIGQEPWVMKCCWKVIQSGCGLNHVTE